MKRWVRVEKTEEVTTSKIVEVEEDQPWQAGVTLEETTRRVLMQDFKVTDDVRKHVVYGRLYRTKGGLYATVERFHDNAVATMRIEDRWMELTRPAKRFVVHIYTGVAVQSQDADLSLEDLDEIPE